MSKLTKRAVEAFEVLRSEYLVWDAELAGFAVRVFPSGRKSCLIQYRADGRTRRRTIGQHGALTADEARREARRLLGDVARGGNPSEERQKRLSAPTVASLCERFLAVYVAEHCKPTTARDYRSMIRRNIIPALGKRRISEITRADLVSFHHDMRDTPYQANRAISLLSKMFNEAENWGLRAEGTNPARRVRKFREVEKKRYLTDAEQARLGNVLAQSVETGAETPHIVSAIYLLMLTGCRSSEIRTLKWSYVTRTHLDLPDSKTGRRRIPLPREASEILDALPRRDGNPYVILGNTATEPLNDLQKPWRRIRKRAGLEDVRLHDLRHTYASVAVMSGVDPFLLKEIMGHRNLQTTLRYAHFADEPVQQAASSIASKLASSMRKPTAPTATLRAV